MNSMTGMGRAAGSDSKFSFRLEIRSVNHKFCEVNVKLPPRFQSFEYPIVNLIKKKLSRGKVDVWVGEDKSASPLSFNKKALKNYYAFLNDIKKELKIKEPVTLNHVQQGFSQWSGKEENTEDAWGLLKKLTEKALDELTKMRVKEGAHLKAQIEKRLLSLEKTKKNIFLCRDEIVKNYQEKLHKRIQQLTEGLVTIEPSRMAAEVAILVDKSDVSEELERLDSHFAQMRHLLKKANEPVGRPLDFLIQEINREWNTIASKSQNANLAHEVVGAKSELEKIREQVQNIE